MLDDQVGSLIASDDKILTSTLVVSEDTTVEEKLLTIARNKYVKNEILISGLEGCAFVVADIRLHKPLFDWWFNSSVSPSQSRVFKIFQSYQPVRHN